MPVLNSQFYSFSIPTSKGGEGRLEKGRNAKTNRKKLRRPVRNSHRQRGRSRTATVPFEQKLIVERWGS